MTPDIQLHCGDCLDVLRTLADGSVDAVVTDPPYGMEWEGNQRFSGGNTRRGLGTRHAPIHGDDRKFDPAPFLRLGKPCVIWGANHFWNELPPAGCLIWLKRNDAALGTFLSDAEIAYFSVGVGVYVHREVFAGSRRAIDAGRGAYEGSAHPNQKPVRLMEWCLDRAKVPVGATVFDPYMGSGTTGVACVNTGRKFIGVEIDPGYFKIAQDRIVSAQRERESLLIPA